MLIRLKDNPYAQSGDANFAPAKYRIVKGRTKNLSEIGRGQANFE